MLIVFNNKGFSSPEIPLKTNMEVAHLECEGKDVVNSSDWLCGCVSVQLCSESVLSGPVGTAPWK